MVNNMSDPVTNAEVEDVLSSIRRLVSQDKRPVGRSVSDAPRKDKLVLTPSLRVSNDAPLVDAYKTQSAKHTPLEDATDEDATASGAQLRGADAVEHATTSDAGAAPHDETDDRFDDVMSVLADEDDFDPTADDLPEDSAEDSGRDFAEGGDADAQQPTASDATDADVGDRLTPSDPPQSARQDRPDMLKLGTSELVEDAAPAPDRLSAKIAALESAISRIPGNWEPDGPGEDDYSGSQAPAMAWEDDVELDATGTPVNDASPDTASNTDGSPYISAAVTPEPDTRLYFEDDSDHESRQPNENDFAPEDVDEAAETQAIGLGADEYLDEEMLRDLVADIVRSELQGALGERITRNVRKLVRREIHRALTAQDLE